MKYLIYSESDEAKALAAELREDKNNEVGIRNPDLSYFDPERPEAADAVYTDVQEIIDAYPEAELHPLPGTVEEAPKAAKKKAKK